ncbi:hypothetical protein QYE76_031509 [Lolium multiflorum]|uniref:RNase H type-1 domain-containing protein n=1 Tax=Lolium multiflorum TaxID=4521 RepID=A0AAD8VJT1_LOLMU|nr:hypothetical protein QYE76_031509 [Lolium multiflorum]
MVLRDHNGGVIAAACRYLDRCGDATEAELQAIEEGMQLAMHWTMPPITLETDCSEAIELTKDKNQNISVYAFTISAIRELLQERDICVTKISRDANMKSVFASPPPKSLGSLRCLAFLRLGMAIDDEQDEGTEGPEPDEGVVGLLEKASHGQRQ